MANTNQGCIVSICATPQDTDLDQAAYELLTFIEIGDVGNVGETGSTTNILNYDTWGTSVTQKAKGVTDAGNPTIEIARDVSDAGQDALRAAAATNRNHAFKIERNDTLGTANTIIYNRGLVSGPTRPNGGVEDFDLEIFTLGFQQREIVVDAT